MSKQMMSNYNKMKSNFNKISKILAKQKRSMNLIIFKICYVINLKICHKLNYQMKINP